MGPSRDAAPGIKRPRVTRADVQAAAMAPDARRRLGDVRAGTLHALEAYRFLGDKQRKTGGLAPAEKVKYERAAQALAEAVGKERHTTMRSDGDVRDSPESGNPPPLAKLGDREQTPHPKSQREMLGRMGGLADQLTAARRAASEAADAMGKVDNSRPDAEAEYARRQEQADAAQKALEQLEERMVETSRYLVEIPPENRGHVEFEWEGDRNILIRARLGAAIAARYTARRLLPRKLKIRFDSDARAGHSPGVIHINESTELSMVAHEVTHETERLNPRVLWAALRFLFKRGLTGEKVTLREYTGRRYTAHETAWTDRWEERGGTVYTGKDCGSNATEILTTGIERLHENPLTFFMTDPEFFDFVTSTLKPR